MNIFPASTDEFLPVTVTQNGSVVTSGVQFSVVLRKPSTKLSDPGTYSAPMVDAGLIGVHIFGYTPGIYDVWAQVSASPQTPVILAGQFEII